MAAAFGYPESHAPTDHPNLTRSLRQRLELRRTQLGANLIIGRANDWADYRERVGVIQGLEEAIALCAEAEKDLSH